MTYVLSDIHGHMDRFLSVLRQIELTPGDTLYILGDVIDRYPYGIELLQMIMGMPNVKMLLGNHEYMMMRALGFPYDGYDDTIGELSSELYSLWYYNGGGVTNLAWNTTPEHIRGDIRDYLMELPLNIDIEVGGKRYKLIHAAPKELYPIYGSERDTVTSFAVWDRDALFFDDPPTDYTVIFGHTGTADFQDNDPMSIWHGKNVIGIDCGCGYPEQSVIKGRLGCLRLEDMKEFYSEDTADMSDASDLEN